ncbi:MAG: DUF1289 domain-containing protein [Gemmatimonadaceae bacterium]|jgi:predicted Fe-S protein YdhL (DUF1289 family)|nr:DUF1289 domain-containing protein [Gemmatimonadaceae bacterium]MCC6432694.1 DUF1289 domain-containing protein [Gemmatimonadaceae bacterium]
MTTPALPPRGRAAGSAPYAPTAESPCIKVCQIDLDDRCRGCGRTLDEIARWREMTREERIAVNQRIGFVSHERTR